MEKDHVSKQSTKYHLRERERNTVLHQHSN